MILSKDFVEKHISQQSTGSGYVLNLRMCHLQDLEYEFQWGRWIERDELSYQDSKKTDQPTRVFKVDASLNELTEIAVDSLLPFLNLKSLDLSLNRIQKMCSLGQFRSLTDVNLSHNKISSILFLSTATAVTNLNLSMNEIMEITSLPTLVGLNVLHLSDNQLTSLNGVQSLPYLKELHVQRNHIDNLTPLSANRHLVSLNAAHNDISSLKNTLHTLQFLTELKSIILFGNPIEKASDYQKAMMSVPSLTSVDNVTLRKDLSHLAHRTETENMSNLKDAARQAFWNQLTLRRDHMEENVRFLQKRILQLQDEFADYESKLQSELETTLMHLDGLTLDPTNRVPLIVPTATTPQPRPSTQNEPVMSPTLPQRPVDSPPVQLQLPAEPKPYIKGDYKGLTDPGEILRNVSKELDKTKNFPRPSKY